MALLNSIFKNFSMVFISDLVGRVLFFFLILSIARFLGAEGLGYYSFVFAFVGLFVLFNDLGLSTLLVREVSRSHSSAQKYISNILSIKVILGVLTFAASAIAIFAAEDRPFIIYAVLLASLAMFFSSMKDTLLSVFQSFERMAFIAAIRAIESFLIVALSMAALLLGYGVIAVTLVFLCIYILTFAASLIAVRRIVKLRLSADFAAWKSFLVQSSPFWLTGFFMAIYFRIDTVMLGIMRGYAETGIYNAAYRLLDALYIIPGALIPVLYPVMSRLHITGRKLLEEVYKRAFSYLLIIALPMAVGATFLAGRIMAFVYRGSFSADVHSAAIGLQILIWAEVFIFLSAISGHLLNSINRQAVFTITAAAAALANVLLNLYFISRWGYIGAAITTVMTEFGVLASLFYFVRRSGYRIRFFSSFIKAVVASAVMASAIYFLLWMHVLAIIAISAAVYFLVIFLLKGFEKQDVDVVKGYFGKLVGKSL